MEFRCIATGTPAPTLEWTGGPNGQLGPTATFRDGVFRIPSVSRRDQAEYHCKATNAAGTADVRTILYVSGGKLMAFFDCYSYESFMNVISIQKYSG